MRTINKRAAVVFNSMIKRLDQKSSIKIDNSRGAFMPVHLEKIETDVNLAGRPVDIYSLSHYYEQNGDLIPDPDMTFAVSKVDSAYIWPLTIQNQFGYKRGIYRAENGAWKINASEQADQAVFAGMWLKNIKQQQDL